MIAFLDLIDNDNDKERFRQLYNKYKGLMAHIAMQKLDSQEDVEDTLQDAFFYIAKHFYKIGDIHSPQTKCFVAVITESYAISRYRKDKKNQNIVSLDEAEINSVADHFNHYSSTDLKMVIDSLSDEYKNLIYLKYVFGYKSREIADIYGITDSSVRKKIQFAKAEIRNMLKGVE